jgi:hypothetical protein
MWRRERLTCPTREQLGSYLLQVHDEGMQDYLDFHLNVIGCPKIRGSIHELGPGAAMQGDQLTVEPLPSGRLVTEAQVMPEKEPRCGDPIGLGAASGRGLLSSTRSRLEAGFSMHGNKSLLYVKNEIQ